MQTFKRNKLLYLSILVWFASLTPSAPAQAVYGSIFGTITDNTGAVVPNAQITVTDIAKGTSVQVQSSGSGDYRVQHLIPDSYRVDVEAPGFTANLLMRTSGNRQTVQISSKGDIRSVSITMGKI